MSEDVGESTFLPLKLKDDEALAESVVETAKNETIAALKKNGLEEESKFINDLKQYSETLIANFQLFNRLLTEWRPD